MIAICDCNSFYASCHPLFDPELWDKPIVVLSNNRGVIVSLNKKAKELGLKRGLNEFENRRFFRQYNVVVFESNYELYYDMSDRVMITIATLVELYEIYSIDEAFISLDGYERFGIYEYSLHIANTVKKNTGIPVSLGIADTKTLAKVANQFAKKYPRFNGVFVMDSEQKHIECLKRIDIGDVWGIGDKLEAKLNTCGIFTAWDFITKISQTKARKIHNVELERTWCELQGVRCYNIEPIQPDKKTIITSRSLPQNVKDIDTLKQALSTYAAICAADLRKQNSYAKTIGVFLETNRFRKNLAQYRPYIEINLPFPANSTLTLAKYALQGLTDIYLEGFEYKKAGIQITKTTKTVQTDLYMPIDKELKQAKISPVEDFYSHGFDRKLCSLAVMGYGDRQQIDLKQENPQKCPTTRFRDIIIIDCTE